LDSQITSYCIELPSAVARTGNIGIDIVELSRIEAISQSYCVDTLRYLFTDQEIKSASEYKTKAEYYGYCFGVKEAVGKALGSGLAGLSWTDIELSDLHLRKVCLKGRALKTSKNQGINSWFLWTKRLKTESLLVGVMGYG